MVPLGFRTSYWIISVKSHHTDSNTFSGWRTGFGVGKDGCLGVNHCFYSCRLLYRIQSSSPITICWRKEISAYPRQKCSANSIVDQILSFVADSWMVCSVSVSANPMDQDKQH